jgi:DNA-directed RNA polymerase subunit RPC12/RpoP
MMSMRITYRAGNLVSSIRIFLVLDCAKQESQRRKLSMLVEMEKTTGNACPRCGSQTLNIYYDDGADLELGALCDSCGLKGFFSGGKLVPLVLA